ncbi:hypothetical protein [Francisella sp. 19X1-34]|uniref:hypothetical protein n=1 Tax=Francisella sp. 19X1-34 TaxID=3087177 RepID=UPI002E35E495|nr:hypothetical protein [Francisella sp. 19X1-34]MED7789672.1 hypothetical protein [Francisella sp. 19X1-34]
MSKQLIGQKHHRSGVFTRDNLSEQDRTLTLSFSSNTPYQRWSDMTETLIHNEDAINFERLNNGANLLFNHDWDKPIGKIEKAWLDGDKAYATVRFSKSAFADEVYSDLSC